jgi:hypothetical protein
MEKRENLVLLNNNNETVFTAHSTDKRPLNKVRFIRFMASKHYKLETKNCLADICSTDKR